MKNSHKVKFLREDDIKKEIISVGDNEKSPWRNWKETQSATTVHEQQGYVSCSTTYKYINLDFIEY